MRRRRASGGVKRPAEFDVHELCRGPGNLTKALGIDLKHNLLDLTTSTLRIEACALGRFYCSGNNWSRIVRRADSLVTSWQVLVLGSGEYAVPDGCSAPGSVFCRPLNAPVAGSSSARSLSTATGRPCLFAACLARASRSRCKAFNSRSMPESSARTFGAECKAFATSLSPARRRR